MCGTSFKKATLRLDRMAQDFAARLVAAVDGEFLIGAAEHGGISGTGLQKGEGRLPAGCCCWATSRILRDEVPETVDWRICAGGGADLGRFSRFFRRITERRSGRPRIRRRRWPMLSPTQVVFLEDGEAIEKLGEKARDESR